MMGRCDALLLDFSLRRGFGGSICAVDAKLSLCRMSAGVGCEARRDDAALEP